MSSAKRKARDAGPAKDLDQVLVKVRDLAKALRTEQKETTSARDLGYDNLVEVSDQKPEEVCRHLNMFLLDARFRSWFFSS